MKAIVISFDWLKEKKNISQIDMSNVVTTLRQNIYTDKNNIIYIIFMRFGVTSNRNSLFEFF